MIKFFMDISELISEKDKIVRDTWEYLVKALSVKERGKELNIQTILELTCWVSEERFRREWLQGA